MNCTFILRHAALFAVFALISIVSATNNASAHDGGASVGFGNTAYIHSFVGGGQINTASGAWATVGGGYGNKAKDNYATVGGGQGNVASSNGTVGGGAGNTAGGTATVGGGQQNRASGDRSTVGGGDRNIASNFHATVGGGCRNTASGYYATVGGGARNLASGIDYATVGGGERNTASGSYATVPGGVRAIARHEGAFVWSGVSTVNTVSTSKFSFTVRAPGGVRFITATNNKLQGIRALPNATAWSILSDRESKMDFKPIKPREVLSKLASMPVTSWRYKHDPSRRYIGPTSQDFMAAFHLGDDDKGINTLDADGVTFAAIQGLVEELKERDKTIDELKAQNAAIESKLQAVEQRLNAFPPQ